MTRRSKDDAEATEIDVGTVRAMASAGMSRETIALKLGVGINALQRPAIAAAIVDGHREADDALMQKRRKQGLENILAGKSPGPWARAKFPELDLIWRAMKPFARMGLPITRELISDCLSRRLAGEGR